MEQAGKNVTWYFVVFQNENWTLFGVYDDKHGTLYHYYLLGNPSLERKGLPFQLGQAGENIPSDTPFFWTVPGRSYSLPDFFLAAEKGEVYLTEVPDTLARQLLTALAL